LGGDNFACLVYIDASLTVQYNNNNITGHLKPCMVKIYIFFNLYIRLLALPGEKDMPCSSCHTLLKDLDIGDIAINKGM